MVITLLFAGLVLLCGLAVNCALRAPVSLAPFTGLASIAVLTTWCAAAGAPALVSTGLVVALALAGLVSTISPEGTPHDGKGRRQSGRDRVATLRSLARRVGSDWPTSGIVAASVAI